MNLPKIWKNVLHFIVIVGTSYFAVNQASEWIWILPGLTWLGQVMEPPDVTPGPRRG